MEDLILYIVSGQWPLSFWRVAAFTLVTTHITIVAVTIFLHRSQAHSALSLHPVVSHFFRFWLWISTGMVTKEFVAVHRKHHAKCETEEDPHSPQVFGISRLLLEGVELYRAAARSMHRNVVEYRGQYVPEIIRYGERTPDDFIERHLYTPYSQHGVWIALFLDVFLLGPIGIVVFAIQMLWIPVMATGIINGIGHSVGYRNFDPVPEDMSTNIVPWGIVIGGEELHNNHHTYPTSAKFSIKTGEFDIGWLYIRLLEIVGLAKVKHVAPELEVDQSKYGSDDVTNLPDVIACRFEIAARMARITRRFSSDEARLTMLWQYQHRLEQLWRNTRATADQLTTELRAWYRDARKSDIPDLQELANVLPGFRVKRVRS